MVKHLRTQSYAEYLKGGSWKCGKSPNGAHYWIVGNQMICKYCLMVRQSEPLPFGKDIVIRPRLV